MATTGKAALRERLLAAVVRVTAAKGYEAMSVADILAEAGVGRESFYDLFATQPVGRHRVLVCTNISCWMRGGDELLESFCEAAGADAHDAAHHGASSADGEFFVKGFECPVIRLH